MDHEVMKEVLQTRKWEKNSLDVQGYTVHHFTEKHLLSDILEGHTDWTVPYLLVSKQIQGEDETNLASEESSCAEDDTKQNESLEGSPLKLQEFRTEHYVTAPIVQNGSCSDRVVLRPVTVSDARLVLSLYCLSSHELLENYLVCDNKSSLPPVWVICDGKDPENSVVLGTHVTQVGDKKHFNTTVISVNGPIFEDSALLNQIWCDRPEFCLNGKALRTMCLAKYSIRGAAAKDQTLFGDNPLMHQQPTSLEVTFHWTRLSSLLQKPPVEAKAAVKATVVVGDSRSAANFMFAELSVLKGLVESLGTGVAQWGADSSEVPLLSQVKALVKELEGGMTFVEPQNKPNQDDMNVNEVFVKQREELDFTEQLWNILKDCSSFQDLIDCFQFVLDCLSKGVLQPVVHRDNKSTLAQLIRDSYYSKMTMPDLDGAAPLELLVEIGLEKMCNDYTHAFLSKELVVLDSLDSYIRPDESPTDRINALVRLHHSLELIAMLETLSLPRMTLSISARQALKHYEVSSSERHTFSIPVQTTDVKSITERYQPSVWQAHLTGQSQDGTEQHSRFLFTETSPFEHVQLSSAADATLAEDTRPYFLTTVTEDTIII